MGYTLLGRCFIRHSLSVTLTKMDVAIVVLVLRCIVSKQPCAAYVWVHHLKTFPSSPLGNGKSSTPLIRSICCQSAPKTMPHKLLESRPMRSQVRLTGRATPRSCIRPGNITSCLNIPWKTGSASIPPIEIQARCERTAQASTLDPCGMTISMPLPSVSVLLRGIRILAPSW